MSVPINRFDSLIMVGAGLAESFLHLDATMLGAVN